MKNNKKLGECLAERILKNLKNSNSTERLFEIPVKGIMKLFNGGDERAHDEGLVNELTKDT